jgi:mono/diheme cytochrome c family protein
MVPAIFDRCQAHAKGLIMRRFILAAAGILLSFTAEAQQTSPFPAGAGRDIIAVACTQCHQVGPIIQLRMGEAGWRRQVYNMVLRGAQIGPAEIDDVVKYLATNFGPGVPIPGQATPPVTLPDHAGADRAGADLVAGACGICHGVDRVVAVARPGRQWEAIVHRMVAIGAPIDADQTRQIISYLETNYGAAPSKAP